MFQISVTIVCGECRGKGLLHGGNVYLERDCPKCDGAGRKRELVEMDDVTLISIARALREITEERGF